MTTNNINEMIWQIIAAIPYGRVASYGQIARLAGFPNHARYVGSILKKLPADSKLPWHRVVNAQGKLAFPVDSDSYQCQRAKLEAEGIKFEQMRLSLALYGWH